MRWATVLGAVNAVVLAACVVTVAVLPGRSMSPPAMSAPSSSTSLSTEDREAQVAADLALLDQLRDAMIAQGSVRVQGQLQADAQNVTVDVLISEAGARGTLRFEEFGLGADGSTVEPVEQEEVDVLRIGPELYLKPADLDTDGAWVRFGPDAPERAAFDVLLDLRRYATAAFAVTREGTVTRTRVIKREGRPVQGLIVDGASFYVTTDEPALPVSLTLSGPRAPARPASTSNVTFSDYGAAVDLTPPDTVIEPEG